MGSCVLMGVTPPTSVMEAAVLQEPASEIAYQLPQDIEALEADAQASPGTDGHNRLRATLVAVLESQMRLPGSSDFLKVLLADVLQKELRRRVPDELGDDAVQEALLATLEQFARGDTEFTVGVRGDDDKVRQQPASLVDGVVAHAQRYIDRTKRGGRRRRALRRKHAFATSPGMGSTPPPPDAGIEAAKVVSILGEQLPETVGHRRGEVDDGASLDETVQWVLERVIELHFDRVPFNEIRTTVVAEAADRKDRRAVRIAEEAVKVLEGRLSRLRAATALAILLAVCGTFTAVWALGSRSGSDRATVAIGHEVEQGVRRASPAGLAAEEARRREAEAELVRLRAELAESDRELAQLANDHSTASTQAQRRIRRLRAAAAEQQGRIEELTAAVATAESEQDRLTGALARAETAAGAAGAARDRAEGELDAMRAARDRAEGELEAVRSQLEAARSELARRRQELASLESSSASPVTSATSSTPSGEPTESPHPEEEEEPGDEQPSSERDEPDSTSGGESAEGSRSPTP